MSTIIGVDIIYLIHVLIILLEMFHARKKYQNIEKNNVIFRLTTTDALKEIVIAKQNYCCFAIGVCFVLDEHYCKAS